ADGDRVRPGIHVIPQGRPEVGHGAQAQQKAPGSSDSFRQSTRRSLSAFSPVKRYGKRAEYENRESKPDIPSRHAARVTGHDGILTAPERRGSFYSFSIASGGGVTGSSPTRKSAASSLSMLGRGAGRSPRHSQARGSPRPTCSPTFFSTMNPAAKSIVSSRLRRPQPMSIER